MIQRKQEKNRDIRQIGVVEEQQNECRSTLFPSSHMEGKQYLSKAFILSAITPLNPPYDDSTILDGTSSLHPYLLHYSFRPRIFSSLLPQACWLSFLNVMLDGRRELRVFIAAFIFFNNGWKNDKEESQKWDTKKNKG